MVRDTIMLKNETGLHARPASNIAQIAMKYKSDINLIVNDKKVNAKSALMIMATGIKNNTQITMECEGEDEDTALKNIRDAFYNIK